MTKTQRKQIDHALRSDFPFQHLYERVETLEEGYLSVLEEVKRDRTLSKRLREIEQKVKSALYPDIS